MAENGLAAWNEAGGRRGWADTITLRDLDAMSAGNPIMQGISAAWPDAPAQAPRSSVDWLRQYLPTAMGDFLGNREQQALTPTSPREVAGDVLTTAMNVLPAGRMPMSRWQGIRAYHGSPYDFDRFDLSRLGTGEGAQAYGHGLYFAENPKTAQSYRDNLAGSLNVEGPNGFRTEPAALQIIAHTALKESGLSHNLARDMSLYIVNALKEHGTIPNVRSSYNPAPGFEGAWNTALTALEPYRIAPNPGKMYEVNINAKPEQFLDWDKLMTQQGPEVLAAARNLKMPEQFTSRSGEPFTITGADAYQHIANMSPFDRSANAASVSAKLRDAGIPGIRYLDQGSRGTGHGTSNYVVFRPEIIDILKKWGLAGGMPLAAAADAYNRDNSQ